MSGIQWHTLLHSSRAKLVTAIWSFRLDVKKGDISQLLYKYSQDFPGQNGTTHGEYRRRVMNE